MTEQPTKHFILQRITAILNIPFFMFFLYLLFIIPGMSYEAAVDLFQKPIILVLTLLLIINFSFHMKLGMQMVIEDYIHGKKNLKLALLLNNIFVSIVIMGCTYSLLTL
ncbi:MAG: succinate dehydrogenase, hydrophobic membrane anchor protein [Rhodobiaceae bacterium]|nr:succinate dehydrogenase, hydrophobic membrane anchor protein [Rhodobiaceae bacterium]